MVSERVQAVAVVVFVLIIGSVVYVLLTNVDRQVPDTSSPSRSAGDDLDSAPQAPVGQVRLASGTGDLVVRTKAGSCTTPGGPKIEVSDNQGRTFRQVRVPQVDDGSGVGASSPAVRAIAFAEATSPLRMTVAAADTDCVIHPYTTTDGGATWTQEDGTVEEWYLDPMTAAVVSPAGPTDAGCADIVSLAPVSKKNAKVFCGGGTIRSTSDGGEEWDDAGELPDTSAGVFTGNQTGYAAVEGSKCKSRIYSTVDGGLSWVAQGCVVDSLALPAMSGTEKRLVAGGTGGVRLSTDGGESWEAPTKK